MPLHTAPICVSCMHKGEGLTCTAFPDRIPDAILFSEVDHRKPYVGDHGIQYALAPGKTLNTSSLDDPDPPVVYTPLTGRRPKKRS
jgi:hypothetical protein